MAISPLDDRYKSELGDLENIFSNKQFTRRRLLVELRYLQALIEFLDADNMPQNSRAFELIWENFDDVGYEKILSIEKETKHDVKAIEIYLAQELTRYKLGEVAPMAHFGLTSEDVNNLAYGLVIREATEYLVRVGADFLEGLIELVRGLGKSVMLARTHGQPAVPTTMAKELLVHARRMADAMMLISDLRIEGKLLGAVGTMAAHRFVFAEKDWLRFSKEFVKGLGLEPILLSTQVVAPTSYMRMMSALVELGMHIEAFCIDMWHYISLGYFKQSFDAKSVGSSTMPQKVNPIRFENAEGNAGLAIALAMAMKKKLSYSRLQRDLSDSTVKRNFGVIYGHLVLALFSMRAGLAKLEYDSGYALEELAKHYEMLMEAIQSCLRASGSPSAYEQIKLQSRGVRMTKQDYERLVEELEIEADFKLGLKELDVVEYNGYADEIVESELERLKCDLGLLHANMGDRR